MYKIKLVDGKKFKIDADFYNVGEDCITFSKMNLEQTKVWNIFTTQIVNIWYIKRYDKR
jgi:hypothetical protein